MYPANASEEMNVTVPVTVRAFANVGSVAFNCMAPFVITRNSDDAPGVPGAVSKFTVSQRLRVDIPVTFGAEANVGEGYVYFASSDSSDSGDSSTDNDPCKCKCKCFI